MLKWLAVSTAAIVFGVLCGSLIWDARMRSEQQSGIRVPLLSGGTVFVEPKDYGKITPLGWAMAIDLGSSENRKAAEAALFAECKKNPNLEAAVLKKFEIKARIDAAKGRRVVITQR